MTHEDCLRLLDGYRDGSLSEGEAQRLAEAIRIGGEESGWIMEELEFSGQLSQALDRTENAAFLRSLLERVHAEETAGEFGRALDLKRSQELRRASGGGPEIHAGTEPSAAASRKRKSSKRIAAVRRPQRYSSERFGGPVLIAALLLAAVTLSLALFQPGARQAPPIGTKSREESVEKGRLAEADLARKKEAQRLAQEEAVRSQAARKAAEERLAATERERRRLEESAQALQKQSAEEQEARRQELVRLADQHKEEAARLASSAAEQRKAEEDLAKADAARKEAEFQMARMKRPDEELGEIVFVAEQRETGRAGPVLVRGSGERLPLAKGAKLLRGDRIESPEPGTARQELRQAPVHAALQLFSGAVADLSAGSALELIDPRTAKLDRGLLYAEVSGVVRPGKEGLTFRTDFADVQTDAASFDLSADATEAILQVQDGGARFKNGSGNQAVMKLQRSVARKDGPPAQASAIGAAELWRGRNGGKPAASAAAASVLLRLDFDDGRVQPDWFGKAATAPQRSEGRGCLAGQDVPENNLTRVRLGDNAKGLFVYREGAVLAFDYWVEAKVSALIVYLWDRQQQISLGGFRLAPPALAKERWSRGTIRLGELTKENKRMQDGNTVVDLTIQTDDGFGVLYIDNFEISVPRQK